MPIKSAKAYGFMQAARAGKLKSAAGPSPEVAKEMIDKTPSKTRSRFMKAIAKRRKSK